MLPEGPYRNDAGYSTGDWYILHTLRRGEKTTVIVRDGQQPHEGVESGSVRDARAWMKDNGFTYKGSNPKLK